MRLHLTVVNVHSQIIVIQSIQLRTFVFTGAPHRLFLNLLNPFRRVKGFFLISLLPCCLSSVRLWQMPWKKAVCVSSLVFCPPFSLTSWPILYFKPSPNHHKLLGFLVSQQWPFDKVKYIFTDPCLTLRFGNSPQENAATETRINLFSSLLLRTLAL